MRISRDGLSPLFIIMMTFIVATLMTVSGAQAQATPDMSPSGLFDTFVSGEGDPYSNILLNQIFGPIFPGVDGAGTGSTLFSSVIGYFNAAMLVVGGLLFFNNLAMGTVQSAHEGEVLGRNWSSLWAPLRTIFAVALLIPLPAFYGYNTAQVFVAFLAKNATNFASSVWTITASNIVTGVVPVSAPRGTIPKSLASEMFLLEMCKVTLDSQFQAAAGSSGRPDTIMRSVSYPTFIASETMIGSSGNAYYTGATSTTNPYRAHVSYDRVGPDGDVKEVAKCGFYRTPEIPDVINNRMAENTTDSLDLSDVVDATTVKTQFMNLHETMMSDLSDDMANIAGQVYSSHQARLNGNAPVIDITASVQSAVEKANGTLNTGYVAMMNTISANGTRNASIRQAMIDRISTSCGEERACMGEGWIGAGAWYMIVARLNNEISSLFIAEGEAQSKNSVRWSNRSGVGQFFNSSTADEEQLQDEFTAVYDYGADVFNVAANRMAAAGWSIDPALITNIAASIEGDEIANDDEVSVKNKAKEFLTGALVSINSYTFTQDPMVGIVDMGKWIVQAGAAMVLLDAVTPGNILSSIGATIGAAGATLSIILPMMPFVFWIMAVTGYLLLIVEAFLAVNLWAISHLRMDGDGITGQAGRDGWLMLLALMVTPFLMVAGYLVGMIIFRITTALMSMGLAIAFAGVLSNGNWFFSMIAVLVLALFITIMYMLIIERSFSMVAEFPSKVLRWMGAAAQLDTSSADRVRAGAAGAVVATQGALGKVTNNMNYGPNVKSGVSRILRLNKAGPGDKEAPSTKGRNTGGS